MAAYFDYGVSHWRLPNREQGMWSTFCQLYNKASIIDNTFLKTLRTNIALYTAKDTLDALQSMLTALSLSETNLQHYLFELFYRYKGWAGLVKSLTHHPEWIKAPEIRPDIFEFTSILVILELAAIRCFCDKLPGVPTVLSFPTHSESFLRHYFYELSLYPDYTSEFTQVLPLLTDHARKTILHKAYERTFQNQFLNAYATQQPFLVENSNYQVVCCLDEREESLRRYLERDPHCLTYGIAGYFGLNIAFTDYFSKRSRSLCPVLIKPEYHIREELKIQHKSILVLFYLWGEILWHSAANHNSLLKSTLATCIETIFSIFPTTLNIITPSFATNIRGYLKKEAKSLLKTQLIYKREDNVEGIDIKTRINVAYNFLVTIGLTHSFGQFIVILGHGSSSLNNPFEAAYNCGACAGGQGAINARLIALILNEPAVREGLIDKNLHIPTATCFIGGYHNTCSDDIDFFDIPDNEKLNFEIIQRKIHEAAELNAKERCRRFTAVAYGRSSTYYHRKAKERAMDIRQTRPEYNHSTNAVCIIGPRSFSRKLFLDRRAFLISYEPVQDEKGLILESLLTTAAPVCAGINLEYFFSYVDNEVYGCGTKLPHNLTSLIGVMNGASSDLQTGLSTQMVEIHQPIRLCFLIICSLSLLKPILKKDTEFSQLVNNEWCTLAVHNIEDNTIYRYENPSFKTFSPMQNLSPPCYGDEDIFDSKHHIHFGHIV